MTSAKKNCIVKKKSNRGASDMINVGRVLADAVKERTPKKASFTRKSLSGCGGNTLATVAGVNLALRY